MKHFERLEGLWRRFKRKYERSCCEKYCHLILAGRICVWDVPLKWRRNFNTARVIYITGFRVARGISMERYAKDLERLEMELQLFKKCRNCNPAFLDKLQRLYSEKKAEFDYYQRRELYDKTQWKSVQGELRGV